MIKKIDATNENDLESKERTLTELNTISKAVMDNSDHESSINTSTTNLINPQPKSFFERFKVFSRNTIVIAVLFTINLVNFMDRFTIAGVLGDTQAYFKIDDSMAGLLQTVFICSYMLLAPLFGYLGDRYTRKWIIVGGVSFWILMTFSGSFVPPDMFWLFLIIRCLVGVGEASYSCIAPTLIGDLYTDSMRTTMLAIFYLAVPVGSGFGYIVGSNIAQATHDWRWALRFTPPIGLVCVVLLALFVKEPKRGGAESHGRLEDTQSPLLEDLLYLIKNKTFMWVSAGFTFASFVLGGLSWWVPLYVQYAIYSKNQIPDQIPLIFGIITCISGLIGVGASSIVAPRLRKSMPHADPIICSVGSLIAVPSLFLANLITRMDVPILFWISCAIAISALCLSWTMVADILLYVIHPNKRSIASAFNILVIHLFGDACSPYILGAISDALRANKPDTYYVRFTSLQYALYTGPVFAFLSFATYLFAAIYVVDDKNEVDNYVKSHLHANNSSSDISSSDDNNSIGYTNPNTVEIE